MATISVDKAEAARAAVSDRVLEAAKQAEQVAHEARRMTERAGELLEDRVHTARRTLKRRVHDLENLRDEAETCVRKNPFTAVGATFTAGLLLGVVIGWASHRRV